MSIKSKIAEELAQRVKGGDSLAMDYASRMQRAKDMGFDTSRPVYHGSATDFDAFDPDRAIGTQFWSTTDRAAIEAGEVGAQGSGVIKEMYQNIQNPASWDEYDRLGIDEIRGRGFDGIELKEGADSTFIAFKPEQYRDVNAAFDPAKKGSPNLLASMGAGTAVGAGLMGSEEAMADQARQEYINKRDYKIEPVVSRGLGGFYDLLSRGERAVKGSPAEFIYPSSLKDWAGKAAYGDDISWIDRGLAGLDIIP